jgi:hypothetical protein
MPLPTPPKPSSGPSVLLVDAFLHAASEKAAKQHVLSRSEWQAKLLARRQRVFPLRRLLEQNLPIATERSAAKSTAYSITSSARPSSGSGTTATFLISTASKTLRQNQPKKEE